MSCVDPRGKTGSLNKTPQNRCRERCLRLKNAVSGLQLQQQLHQEQQLHVPVPATHCDVSLVTLNLANVSLVLCRTKM